MKRTAIAFSVSLMAALPAAALAQTEHEKRGYLRTVNANLLQGVATRWVGPAELGRLVPIMNLAGPRYPVLGGLYQERGGTARHDAVAWGYARACSDMGMHIIQNCEVTGFVTDGDRVVDAVRAGGLGRRRGPGRPRGGGRRRGGGDVVGRRGGRRRARR